jgi:hypothetical protein
MEQLVLTSNDWHWLALSIDKYWQALTAECG